MAEKKSLIDLLNALLEAERAGVETVNHFLKHHQSEELHDRYKQVKKDEAWSCAGLHDAILREDGVPSKKAGAFAEKVKALDTLEEKLALLNKGQGWVARKIDEAITYKMHPKTEAFLKEMKQKHVTNIESVDAYLKNE